MAFQFKIQLKNITSPPVWRRILVPEKYTFHDLHVVIQIAFPWEDFHLYMFNPTGYGSHPVISAPDQEDFELPELDSTQTRLDEVFTVEKQKFTYIYDFGDDWIHNIILEKKVDNIILFPRCIGGKGTCPPEDCGGANGYESLKQIMDDPKHAKHNELREWLFLEKDENWDADFVDLKQINEMLVDVFGR